MSRNRDIESLTSEFFNMTYLAIRVLSALGLAHSLKLPNLTSASTLPTGVTQVEEAPSEHWNELAGSSL